MRYGLKQDGSEGKARCDLGLPSMQGLRWQVVCNLAVLLAIWLNVTLRKSLRKDLDWC